jgi:UDP-glucose:(heptosyl)LPS alpha-1,3-glucosyltransferase
LGHGFERKGLRTALEALALSRDKDSSLWIAGRDSTAYWKGIATRLDVAKRVKFLGASKDSDKLLAAADGLILPTKYDAFANVTLEAAASGCPVLTSRSNGGAEWLGEAGLSVEDPRDSNSFAEGLDALSDPNYREQLREAGRKKAESTSWNHHITTLRTLYKEVSSRKREMGLL